MGSLAIDVMMPRLNLESMGPERGVCQGWFLLVILFTINNIRIRPEFIIRGNTVLNERNPKEN